MALTVTVKNKMVLGGARLLDLEITGDGATQYYDTGFNNVFTSWYGGHVQIDTSNLAMINNSSDGTEGTAPGYLYWDGAVTSASKMRVLCLTSG